MKIDVYAPTVCTYVLEDGEFVCSHDEVETEIVETPYMTIDGVDTYESEIYVCAGCGEQLEGSPAEDRAEAQADYEAEMAMDCE